MTNTRQPGYYRVKYKGKWTIGRWIHEDGLYHWAISETEYYYYYYSDNELDEIDPTPINPEPQQDRTEEWKRELIDLIWDTADTHRMARERLSKLGLLPDQEAGKV